MSSVLLLQIDIDFQCLHKEASNMLDLFDNFKIKLIKVIVQKLKKKVVQWQDNNINV